MSLYIAKIMGPVLAIIALGILINTEKYLQLTKDFFDNFALYYISSFITITLGLVMVNAHNIWVLDWPVVITVFSWLIFTKGCVLILFPNAFTKFADFQNKTVFRVIATIYLIIGSWLSLLGYTII